MAPSLDTQVAALTLERTLALKRAERRALLTESAKQPRSARASAGTTTALARWDRLSRTVRSLRRGLRPAHAWLGRASPQWAMGADQ
jgi:hypothetical protein